jgi:type VI secretion system secreted protein VgrG
MSEGLSWRFEHEQTSPAEDGASGEDKNSTPKARHKLVIFDSGTQLPTLPAGAALRYHGVRATDTDDAINMFSAVRQVQANAVSISSWHPQQLSAPASELSSSLNNGALPALAIYDGAGESQYDDAGAANQQNVAMLRAAEMGNKLFTGHGSVRRLAAGYGFSLSQHDNYAPGSDSFKLVSVEHNATNNLDAGMAQLLGANMLERGTYRNSFTCLRDAVPIVPADSATRTAPTALGAQIALVVGLDGAPVTSERDHRIKVQFPWQRGQAPHAGGLADTGSAADTKGNAPGNETSGAWVRVAEAMAGPNWGSNFTPRIGSEVLVDFIEGNMDRPVIVAQLFNGSDTPPYSAGADSGINHAGAISGMHSSNLGGDGYNQWVVDDSPNQLRMRLASSTAASQLNLGYLVSQAPDSAQRGSYRGQGFELHTDAWNVLRGGAGVLISSNTRPAQGSSVSSTQMDAAESVQKLAAAKDQHGALAKAAEHQQALGSHAAAKAQDDMLAQIDPKKDGKHPSTVNGQAAQKAQDGSRTPDASKPVEKFAQPLVHIEGPNNIHLASPATSLTYSGQHLQWNTQSDTHWAAAHTLSSVSGQATSLFTNAGGMQIFSGNGPLSMQAHTDKLEILADKQVTIISVNDQIEINAKEKIVLQAGQSSVTLEGGNITFACPGEFTVKGAQHQFGSGASKAAELKSLPSAS